MISLQSSAAATSNLSGVSTSFTNIINPGQCIVVAIGIGNNSTPNITVHDDSLGGGGPVNTYTKGPVSSTGTTNTFLFTCIAVEGATQITITVGSIGTTWTWAVGNYSGVKGIGSNNGTNGSTSPVNSAIIVGNLASAINWMVAGITLPSSAGVISAAINGGTIDASTGTVSNPQIGLMHNTGATTSIDCAVTYPTASGFSAVFVELIALIPPIAFKAASSAAGTAASTTIQATIAVGDCVVLIFSNSVFANTVTVSDNGGNTYTFQASSTNLQVLSIYTTIATNQATSITFTPSSLANQQFYFFATYTGVASIGNVNVNDSGATNSNAPSITGVLTSVNNWMVAGLSVQTTSVLTATSGTLRASQNGVPSTALLDNTGSLAPVCSGTVTTANRTANAFVELVAFTAATTPSLSAINPATGNQGTTVPVTLTGMNLTGATGINVSGTGITVQSISVDGDTQISANLVIAGTATLGARTVSVTTANGTSNTVTFTVSAAPTGIQFKNSAVANTTVANPLTVPFAIAIGDCIVVNATIYSTATGSNISSVTDDGGNLYTLTFTFGAGPGMYAYTTIATAAASNVNINYVAGTTQQRTAIISSYTGVASIGSNANSFSQAGSTSTPSMNSTLAATNNWAVVFFATNTANRTFSQGTLGTFVNQFTGSTSAAVATNTGNTSLTTNLAMTPASGYGAIYIELVAGVAPSLPVLTSINPTSGLRGTSVPITLTGTGLTGTSSINVNGAGVTVSNLTVVSSTTVTATLTIASTTTIGARSVSVTNPQGTSNTVTFTITANVPTITSISPNTGTVGQGAVTVNFTGTDFTSPSNLSITPTGQGVTLSGTMTVTNATSGHAILTIGASAIAGTYSIVVTTAAGASNAVTFTVLPPAPTLTSINPDSAEQGTTQSVTLTGTNFTGATALNVSGTGVAVSNLTVLNSTTVTATFTLDPNATVGPRTVTITTPSGTSGTITFTVNLKPVHPGIIRRTRAPIIYRMRGRW